MKKTAQQTDLATIGKTEQEFNDLKQQIKDRYDILIYKIRGRQATYKVCYYLNLKPGSCLQITNEFGLTRLREWFEDTDTRARDVLSRAETDRRKALAMLEKNT